MRYDMGVWALLGIIPGYNFRRLQWNRRLRKGMSRPSPVLTWNVITVTDKSQQVHEHNQAPATGNLLIIHPPVLPGEQHVV